MPRIVSVSYTHLISDSELLSVQPVLEGRIWRAGIAVQVGDLFTYKGALWRCIQPHTTQDDWAPDLTPVSYTHLNCADTEEYRQYGFLQNIFLGDSVRVIARRIGVDVSLRMTQYTYCLLYTSRCV